MARFSTFLSRAGKKRTEFATLEFLFWATFAANTYTVVFLKDRGFSNSVIGTLTAINAFIGIIAQPVWGMVSDWMQSLRKVFRFCFIMSALFFVCVPYTHSPFSTGLLLATVVLFSCPLVALLDSWVISGTINERNVTYGSVRLWGSIGFAVVVFIYGKVIDIASAGVIFPGYLAMAVITVLFCSRIDNGSTTYRVKLTEMNVSRLFRNYYYMVFVVFVLLLNIPIVASSTFLPILLESVGGSRAHLGIAHSIKALAEIPVLFLGRSLVERFGCAKLTVFATMFYVLQQLLFSLAAAPGHAVFATVLQGPAYSLLLVAMVHYIYYLAPDELKATAQTMANAISFGLSGVVGNYAGGLFIDRFGLTVMYRLGFVSHVVILVLFMLSFPLGRYLTGTSAEVKTFLSKEQK